MTPTPEERYAAGVSMYAPSKASPEGAAREAARAATAASKFA